MHHTYSLALEGYKRDSGPPAPQSLDTLKKVSKKTQIKPLKNAFKSSLLLSFNEKKRKHLQLSWFSLKCLYCVSVLFCWRKGVKLIEELWQGCQDLNQWRKLCVRVEGGFPPRQHQITQNISEISPFCILSILWHSSSYTSRFPN